MVYIVFARFKRLSLFRQERYVYPLAKSIIEVTEQRKERIANLILRRKMKLRKTERSAALKIFLFVSSAIFINIGMALLLCISVTQKVFINVLVGWKGMKLGSLDEMFSRFTRLLEQLAFALYIPDYLLNTVMFPFYILYRLIEFINFDFMFKLLSVACEGAKSPIELFIISLALGVAILFVESHYGIIWSVTLQDMNRSIFVNYWIEGKKLFSFGFISSSVALLVTSVNPFVTILRFFLSNISIGSFFANNHVSHNISVACLNIAGFENQELLLVIATSILVWLLIAPMLYIIAQVVCPKGGYTATKFQMLTTTKKVTHVDREGVLESGIPTPQSVPGIQVERSADNEIVDDGDDYDISSISTFNSSLVSSFIESNSSVVVSSFHSSDIGNDTETGIRRYDYFHDNSEDDISSISTFGSNNASKSADVRSVYATNGAINESDSDAYNAGEKCNQSTCDGDGKNSLQDDSTRSSVYDSVQYSEAENHSRSSVYDSVRSSNHQCDSSSHSSVYDSINSSVESNSTPSSVYDSIRSSSSSDSSVYSLPSTLAAPSSHAISTRLPIVGICRYVWSYVSLVFSVDLSLVYSIIAWVTYCEKSNRREQLLQLRSNQRWNRQAFEESIGNFRTEQLSTDSWTRYMKYFHNLEKSSGDANDRIEKKWHEAVHQPDSEGLPPYYRLCIMEQQELQELLSQTKTPPFLQICFIPFSCLVIVSNIGHLVTAVGRKNWLIVIWKYALFGCICVGIWTDEIYEAYELDSLPKIFAEKDSNEALILLVPLIISFRAILLQALGTTLTLASIAVISLSSSPLFVFSPKMQARIPPLIYWNCRKVAVEREEKENGLEGQSEEWAINLRSLSIFLTESRLLVFFSNVVPLYLTIVLLEGVDISTGFQFLLVLALVPYFVGSTLMPIVYIGKRLNLRDADFRVLCVRIRRPSRIYPKFFGKRRVPPSSTTEADLGDEFSLPSVSSLSHTSSHSRNEAGDSSVCNTATPQVNTNELFAQEDSDDSYYVSTESEVEPEENSIDKAESISKLSSEVDDDCKEQDSNGDKSHQSGATNIDADDISVYISTDSGDEDLVVGLRNHVIEIDSDGISMVSTDSDEDLVAGQRNHVIEIDADSITVYVSTESDEDLEGPHNLV